MDGKFLSVFGRVLNIIDLVPMFSMYFKKEFGRGKFRLRCNYLEKPLSDHEIMDFLR